MQIASSITAPQTLLPGVCAAISWRILCKRKRANRLDDNFGIQLDLLSNMTLCRCQVGGTSFFNQIELQSSSRPSAAIKPELFKMVLQNSIGTSSGPAAFPDFSVRTALLNSFIVMLSKLTGREGAVYSSSVSPHGRAFHCSSRKNCANLCARSYDFQSSLCEKT